MSDDLPDWLKQYRWEIGARLRRLRLDRGLSQAELAKQAGVDIKTISRLENGVYNIGIDYLARIARALEVPPWRLLRDD